MARVRVAVASRRRRKKIRKAAKGQFGARSRRTRQAQESVRRGMVFATRDRRVKKRTIRALWVVRINAACRKLDISYSVFMNGLKKKKIVLDRKILADIAVHDPNTFGKLVELVKG